MDDRELRDLLRRLPRDSAPPDFGARILARLDGVDRRARARRRAAPALGFALALVLAAGAAVTWTWQRREGLREDRIARARLESLEHEYRDLQDELAELQRLVASAQPVVGVEGPGERGYVLDLGELAEARANGAVPVAYRLPY
ncbi:MAG TPA: hypothetical protein VMS86_12735 [Thermoanaerobaculia bacterium]|nr:hypothetical protein [Thermoanaerobaculia bacterium]